jgi:hypothetical protein
MTVTLPGIPSTVQAGVIDFAGAAIPLVEPRRFDERETCRRALRYLAGDIDGAPSDYQTCAQYRAGRCTRGGACMFHEADDAMIWRRAAQWRLLIQPDGSECVTPATSALEIAADLGAMIVGAVPVEAR